MSPVDPTAGDGPAREERVPGRKPRSAQGASEHRSDRATREGLTEREERRRDIGIPPDAREDEPPETIRKDRPLRSPSAGSEKRGAEGQRMPALDER